MAKDREKFIADLEKAGEKQIREWFIQGKYGHGQPDNQIYWIIKSWLDSREALRAEAREEAMLSTAREANSIASKARSEARRANRIAISAAIIAALSMITTIIIAVLT